MSSELKEYIIVVVAAVLFTLYHSVLLSFYLTASHDIPYSLLYLVGVESLSFLPLGGAMLVALWVSKKVPSMFSVLDTRFVLMHVFFALLLFTVHSVWQAYVSSVFFDSTFSVSQIKFDYFVYLEMRFFAYIIIVGITAGLLRLRESRSALEEEMMLETELHNEMLKEMELKINPEVIYPNLTFIRDYAKEDPKKSSKMVIYMAGLLRQMVDNLDHEKVTIKQDLKFLELFVDIISLRLGRPLLLKSDVSHFISTEQIPSILLLFPFIEEMMLGKYKAFTSDVERLEYVSYELLDGGFAVQFRFVGVTNEKQLVKAIKEDPVITGVRGLIKELRDKEYIGTTIVEEGVLMSTLKVRKKEVAIV